jgi:hypothetical protein
MIRRTDSDGNRWALWPISLRWVPPLRLSEVDGPHSGAPRLHSAWLATHGWWIENESVPAAKTAFGMMPGFRKVYGQTLHLGRLKICFGKTRNA